MKQYNALNVAKFLANTGIIFHHYQQITHFSFNRLLDFYYGYFYWGYLVELFFCISGFLSIHYIDRIDAGFTFGKFILNKYKRFAPTLFVSACIYSIVVFLYQIIVAPEYQVDWDHINQPIDIWKFLTCILCIVVDPSKGTIMGVTWTISVLMICYICFYIIVSLSKKINTTPAYLFVAMIFIGIMVLEYNINAPFFNSYAARGYCGFFSGVLLGLYLKENGQYKKVIC